MRNFQKGVPKSMNRKDVERRIIRIAVVLLAVAVVIACFAIVRLPFSLARLLLMSLAAIPFAISLFLVYIVVLGHLAGLQKRNFFLYDRKHHKNISPDDLTVERVSECLLRYMVLFRQGKQLYLSALFDESGGAPEVFKPLFCYQLLTMLSGNAEDAQLRAFLSCGKELADAFSTYLGQAGELTLGRELQNHIASFDGTDVAPFRNYLHEKSDYLAGRMLSYTKEHIHDFD